MAYCTNNFVYERLAPEGLDELRKKPAMLPSKSRKQKHHQWFTMGCDHPKLREHHAGSDNDNIGAVHAPLGLGASALERHLTVALRRCAGVA